MSGQDPATSQRRVREISERLAVVTDRLRAVGREDIRVVAVSKAFPAEAIAAAHQAGLVDFGESYAQEFAAKRTAYDALANASVDATADTDSPGPTWHFIGGLQRNKVRKIAHLVDLWHSVDRPSLATEIAKHSPGAKVMLQVDISGEASKKGCPPQDLEALLGVAVDAGLSVTGLMGIAPLAAPAESRSGFQLLRSLADQYELQELSMGMSADLEIAAEEGSTMVRIGSALFGEREGKQAQ